MPSSAWHCLSASHCVHSHRMPHYPQGTHACLPLVHPHASVVQSRMSTPDSVREAKSLNVGIRGMKCEKRCYTAVGLKLSVFGGSAQRRSPPNGSSGKPACEGVIGKSLWLRPWPRGRGVVIAGTELSRPLAARLSAVLGRRTSDACASA